MGTYFIGETPQPKPQNNPANSDLTNLLTRLREEQQRDSQHKAALAEQAREADQLNTYRQSELGARKEAESRYFNTQQSDSQRLRDEQATRAQFGWRGLQQDLKAREADFNLYTSHVNRLTQKLVAAGTQPEQLQAYMEGTAKPPPLIEADVKALQKAVQLQARTSSEADSIVASYNKEFGLGILLGVDRANGRFALSNPYIPGQAAGSAAGSAGGTVQPRPRVAMATPGVPAAGGDRFDSEIVAARGGGTQPTPVAAPRAATPVWAAYAPTVPSASSVAKFFGAAPQQPDVTAGLPTEGPALYLDTVDMGNDEPVARPVAPRALAAPSANSLHNLDLESRLLEDYQRRTAPVFQAGPQALPRSVQPAPVVQQPSTAPTAQPSYWPMDQNALRASRLRYDIQLRHPDYTRLLPALDASAPQYGKVTLNSLSLSDLQELSSRLDAEQVVTPKRWPLLNLRAR